MKRWLQVVLIAAISVALGGIFYSTLLIDPGLQRLLTWVVGLGVGLLVYVGFGLVECRYVHSHRRLSGPASLVAALFARSPGLWQVLRIGLSANFGLLLSAVVRNALFDVRYIWIASVIFTAAIAAGLSFGLYEYRRRSSS